MKTILFTALSFLSLNLFAADGYLAKSNNVIVIGPGGSSGSQTPWTSDINGAGFAGTNIGSLSVTGAVTVTGSGSNYLGSDTVVNGKITVTGITNSGLTASRITMTDANKASTSAAASGSSVGVAGDGSAITFGSGLSLSSGTLTATGGGGTALYSVFGWSLSSGRSYDKNNAAFASAVGSFTGSADGDSLRTPIPITGTLTNLIAQITHGGNPVPAGTNVGVTLLTNGTASSLTGVLGGDASTTILYITNVGLSVVRGTKISLRFTNDMTGSSTILSQGTIQLTAP